MKNIGQVLEIVSKTLLVLGVFLFVIMLIAGYFFVEISLTLFVERLLTSSKMILFGGTGIIVADRMMQEKNK